MRWCAAAYQNGASVFDQPVIRINIDMVEYAFGDWNEETAWDQLADHYATRFEVQRR